MTNSIKLNPYTITWVILIPTKGIATKKDASLTFHRGMFKSYLACHSGNLENAKNKVQDLKGMLSKEYKVLFITDKQFGMIEIDFKNDTNNLMDIATSKQKSEMFLIK